MNSFAALSHATSVVNMYKKSIDVFFLTLLANLTIQTSITKLRVRYASDRQTHDRGVRFLWFCQGDRSRSSRNFTDARPYFRLSIYF
jgi:hypothetical protein